MRGPSKIALFALVSLAACGGGDSEKPPVPLPHHFDEMYLAKLGPQQPVIDANSQWQIARAENAKAQSDYDDSSTQLQVARNDLKQTQIAIDSAITQKSSAQKTGDTNAINQATIQEHNAEELKKAAEARVHFLEAYRHYIKLYWLYTQENMYWRESQLEQTKAGIAKQNNIAPAKLDFNWFPGQVDERGKRTQHAKDRVAKDKQTAASAHDAWRKVQDQADKDNGKPTSSWDPMAPQAQPPEASGRVDIKTMSNAGSGTADPAPAKPQ